MVSAAEDPPRVQRPFGSKLTADLRYTANVVAMTQDGSHVVHFPDDNSREIVNLHSVCGDS